MGMHRPEITLWDEHRKLIAHATQLMLIRFRIRKSSPDAEPTRPVLTTSSHSSERTADFLLTPAGRSE
jgi:hypothetical protein